MEKIATVKWLDNMCFVGQTASGHGVVMDGPPDIGGQNLARARWRWCYWAWGVARRWM